ncbi:hypothetical protein [Noviherbaspirillum suwonense]|uniref:DUF4212 domain-containing protein n=1 Tax=Noviherbaspirillum suwonense TaxID=1224511 RepID=A0ABY1QWK1_9BURK|nr:hypothetical protein [Noviherbaspirillum suwonense]SMP79649.1 hypothetical protein SAMN06295970_13223 [Noviherbaspirillum suwonense]
MTYYRRSRRRPSQYRFLFKLKPTAFAFVFAVFLDQVLNVPCSFAIIGRIQPACRAVVPTYVWWGIVFMGIYGIAACLYRYYRDFYLGEYVMDLEDR